MDIVVEGVHEIKGASAPQITQEQKDLPFSGQKRQLTLPILSGDVVSEDVGPGSQGRAGSTIAVIHWVQLQGGSPIPHNTTRWQDYSDLFCDG